MIPYEYWASVSQYLPKDFLALSGHQEWAAKQLGVDITGKSHDEIMAEFYRRATPAASVPGTGVATNLATNPSFETTSGTVEVRRNLCLNPNPTSGWGSFRVSTSYLTTPNRVSLAVTEVGFFPRSGYTTKIPVTAGQSYSMSTEVGVAGSASIALHWLTSAGTDATAAWSTRYSTTATAGQTIAVTGTAPSDATQVEVVVGFPDSTAVGATQTFGKILAEQTTLALPYFDGATPVKVRRNVLQNPRMATGTGSSNYFAPTVSLVASDGPTGGNAIQALYNPDSNIAQGRRFSTVLPIGSMPVNAAFRIIVRVKAPAGRQYLVALNTNSGSSGNGATTYTGTGGWQEHVIDGVTPTAETVGANIIVRNASPATDLAGGDLLFVVDSASLEFATSGPYFDGATGAPAGFATAWEGSADASASYLYDADFTPAWTGTANASTSVLTGKTVVNATPGVNQALGYQTAQNPYAGAFAFRAYIQQSGNIGIALTPGITLSSGTVYTMVLRVRGSRSGLRVTPRIGGDNSSANASRDVYTVAGEWVELRYTAAAGSSSNTTGVVLWTGAGHLAGDTLDLDGYALVPGVYGGPYFDGNTVPKSAYEYTKWDGAVNGSTSTYYQATSGQLASGYFNSRTDVQPEWIPELIANATL